MSKYITADSVSAGLKTFNYIIFHIIVSLCKITVSHATILHNRIIFNLFTMSKSASVGNLLYSYS